MMPVKSTRGKNVTRREIDDWVAEHERGRSFVDIGRNAKRASATVRRHILRDIERRKATAASEGVLSFNRLRHYQELMQFLVGLSDRLVLPSIGFQEPLSLGEVLCCELLPPRDQLLLRSLKDHLPDSALWKHLDEWSAAYSRFRDGAKSLLSETKERATEERGRLTDVDVEDGFVSSLAEQGVRTALGGSLNIPAQMRVQKRDSAWELWRGASERIARAQSRGKVESIQRAFYELAQEILTWDEVDLLRQYYAELTKARTSIEQLVHELTLRVDFPGQCQFCGTGAQPKLRTRSAQK